MKTTASYCVTLAGVLLTASSLPAIEENQPALTGYRTLISEIEERAMNANRVVSELETSIRQQEVANLKLQKELEGALQENKNLREETGKLRETSKELDKANLELSEKLKAAAAEEEKHARLQSQLDDAKGRIMELEGQIAQLSGEKALIQKELDKIRGILGRFSTNE